ncbi:MAG: glycosyltransferase [Blautia sp.]
MPLYNTPEPFLKALIDSITAQTYGKFELCLADGSTDEKTAAFVEKQYGSDKGSVWETAGSERRNFREHSMKPFAWLPESFSCFRIMMIFWSRMHF